MKTETIDVPHFEGYKCVGYRIPNKGEYYLREDRLQECLSTHDAPWLVYEKLTPKRYVFEETGEYRKVLFGELYFNDDDDTISRWYSEVPSCVEYKILRRIDE